MRRLAFVFAAAGLWIVGCAEAVRDGASGGAASEVAAAPLDGEAAGPDSQTAATQDASADAAPLQPPPAQPIETAAPAADGQGSSKLTPVPITSGTATLTPENTRLRFVGTHKGEKPDPRTGSFGKFTGQAQLDSGSLNSLSVEIDTTSLWTEIPKLTDHLKSPDFFEVREYPWARFESTQIEAGADGQSTITGDLTLHGVTQEIRFPATVQVRDGGLTLTSQFTIDRSRFGMNYGLENVHDAVSLTVSVGEKNQPAQVGR
jgi:polyisoprenoid-binding protein YceI